MTTDEIRAELEDLRITGNSPEGGTVRHAYASTAGGVNCSHNWQNSETTKVQTMTTIDQFSTETGSPGSRNTRQRPCGIDGDRRLSPAGKQTCNQGGP